MSDARAKICVDSEGRFYGVRIDCPAGHEHTLPVDWTPPGMVRSPYIGKGWGFNGDLARPTFTPSILMRSGHHADGKPECWCNFGDRFPGEQNQPEMCCLCHSFVTDGRIQFLDDCSHALAGQTVDLPSIQ